MRRAALVALACLVAVLLVVVLNACTHAQRAAVPALERAACTLLRGTSPEAETICATADELAPLVPMLLAARAGGVAPARMLARPCIPLDAGAGEDGAP